MKGVPRALSHGLDAFLVDVAALFISAFALPTAIAVVRMWTCLYTIALPCDVRERRRKEMESELSEQIRDHRSTGYRPGEIALHVFARWCRGIPNDICWSAERHWTLVVAAWTISVVLIWAYFVFPRMLRAKEPNDKLGLVVVCVLLLVVFCALSVREQVQRALCRHDC
jgi:hypothetical protein